MRRLLILLMFLIGCTSEMENENDVTLQTIDNSLKELIKNRKTALINVGNIEDGYFRKKLMEIKYDTLLKIDNLNKDLLKGLHQIINSEYHLDLSHLGDKGHLMYSNHKLNVDSLLNSGVLVYELGYSKAQVVDGEAIYYVELIDPSHRISGKGILCHLLRTEKEWKVSKIINGWEMSNDTIHFFNND